jgi:GT2 family glycosyltransferase
VSVAVSVVIPSCDRPEQLSRCLEAVLNQETERPFEVVVIDDGRSLPVKLASNEHLAVIQGSCYGPAAARNLGIRKARAPIVCFTDDDTIPAPSWIEAAAAALESRPDAVGVEGPTECQPYDPLYRVGPRNTEPGARWTCNVAYRRGDLLEVGGFDEGFPFPFCEDRDLGERMAARGLILYAHEMRVFHPPRPLRLADVARHGAWLESEWRLYRKHPGLEQRWPIRWAGVIRTARRWQRVALAEVMAKRSLRRIARAVTLGLVATAAAFRTAVARWPGPAS